MTLGSEEGGLILEHIQGQIFSAGSLTVGVLSSSSFEIDGPHMNGEFRIEFGHSDEAVTDSIGELGFTSGAGDFFDISFEGDIQIAAGVVASGHFSAEIGADGVRISGNDIDVLIGSGAARIAINGTAFGLTHSDNQIQNVSATGQLDALAGSAATIQGTVTLDLAIPSSGSASALMLTGSDLMVQTREQTFVGQFSLGLGVTDTGFERLVVVGDQVKVTTHGEINQTIHDVVISLGEGDDVLVAFVDSAPILALAPTSSQARGVSRNAQTAVSEPRFEQSGIHGNRLVQGGYTETVRVGPPADSIHYGTFTGDFNYQKTAPPVEVSLTTHRVSLAVSMENQQLIDSTPDDTVNDVIVVPYLFVPETTSSFDYDATAPPSDGHRIDGQPVDATHAAIAVAPGQVLDGAGHAASITNGGTYSPGNSPAIDNVDDLTQAGDATLVIEIGGTSPGPGGVVTDDGYDQVNVVNTANLDGTLQISFINDFVPEVGQEFTILTYGDVSGRFANAEGLFGFGDGSLFLKLVEEEGALKLVVTPLSGEPLRIEVDGEAANGIGVAMNVDYFTDFTMDSVVVTGRLWVSDFAVVEGTFGITAGVTEITVNTNLPVDIGGVLGGLGESFTSDASVPGRAFQRERTL